MRMSEEEKGERVAASRPLLLLLTYLYLKKNKKRIKCTKNVYL